MSTAITHVDGVQVAVTFIGNLDTEYGMDRYVLLKAHDATLTEGMAEQVMVNVFHHEPSGPGRQFCTSSRVIRDAASDDCFIGIAFIRYDC